LKIKGSSVTNNENTKEKKKKKKAYFIKLGGKKAGENTLGKKGAKKARKGDFDKVFTRTGMERTSPGGRRAQQGS